MLTDLTDTTTADIRAALAQTRDQMGGPATGVVLNLIIMTDESGQHDAVRAASQAGREQRPPRRCARPAQVRVAWLVAGRQCRQRLSRRAGPGGVGHPPLGENTQRLC